MRSLLLVLAFCILTSAVADAQWLETTVELPGSFYPYALCYDELDALLFVASDSNAAIWVIDGTDNRLVGSINLPYKTYSLCWNRNDGKLYCAHRDVDSMSVVICSTGVVDTVVRTGDGPQVIAHSPVTNQIYCADFGAFDLWVYDGTTNRFLRRALLHTRPNVLCYAANVGKLFCSNSGWRSVSVIVDSPSVAVREVATVNFPTLSCYDTVDRRLYVVHSGSNGCSVIDAVREYVTNTIDLEGSSCSIGYNPCYNKVYIGDRVRSNVRVIDCRTNAVVTRILTAGAPKALEYNPHSGHVYCAVSGGDNIAVFHGRYNSYIRTIDVGIDPVALAWNDRYGRMYVANHGSSSISVIRDTTPLSVAGPSPTAARNPTSRASVIGRALWLASADSTDRTVGLALFDCMGRTAMRLSVGANDISVIAPGIYFVRGIGAEPSQGLKVVITH